MDYLGGPHLFSRFLIKGRQGSESLLGVRGSERMGS